MSDEAHLVPGGGIEETGSATRADAARDDANESVGVAGLSKLQFVAPSSYLRPLSRAHASSVGASGSASGSNSRPATSDKAQMTPLEHEQIEGLVCAVSFPISISKELTDAYVDQRAIRAFLKVRTSYDVLPLSYRLIVFDTSLLIKQSLNVLNQCGTSRHRSCQHPHANYSKLSSRRHSGTRRPPLSPDYSPSQTTSTSCSTTGRTPMLYHKSISFA